MDKLIETRFRQLEVELITLREQVNTANETIAKLRTEQRSEIMHSLGVVLLQMGDKLLKVANSDKKFLARQVTDDEKSNESTFYAYRGADTDEGGWTLNTMQDGAMTPFDFSTLAPGAQQAIKELLDGIPVGEDNVAFNLYRN